MSARPFFVEVLGMNNMPSFGPSAFVKFELLPWLVEGSNFNLASTSAALLAITTVSLVLGALILRKLPQQIGRAS